MELDMILSPPSTPPLNNGNCTVGATVSFSLFYLLIKEIPTKEITMGINIRI